MRDLVVQPEGPTLEQWRLWGRVLRKLAAPRRVLILWPERALIVRIDPTGYAIDETAVSKIVAMTLVRRGLVAHAQEGPGCTAYRLSEAGRDVVKAGTTVIDRLERENAKLREANAILQSVQETEFEDEPDDAPAIPAPLDMKLTASERQLLLALVASHGQVVEHEALYTRVYGPRGKVAPKIIDVFICKVRRKLRDHWPEAEIVTQWGRGYFFRFAHEAPSGIEPPAAPAPPRKRKAQDGPIEAPPPAPSGIFDDLTNGQAQTLRRLIDAAPEPVARDDLGPSGSIMVNGLRAILPARWPGARIVTEWGVGYRLCAAVAHEAAE